MTNNDWDDLIMFMIAAFLLMLLVLLPLDDANAKQTKVTLCHNGNTITVAEPASEAHLREHEDDYLGECHDTPVSSQQPDPEPTPQPDPGTPDPVDPGPGDKEIPEAPGDGPGGVGDDDPDPTPPTDDKPRGPATSPSPQVPSTPQECQVYNPAADAEREPEVVYLDSCGRRVQDSYSVSVMVQTYEGDPLRRSRFIIDAPWVDMSESTAVSNVSRLWYENMVISDYELSEVVKQCRREYTAFLGYDVDCRVTEVVPMLSGRW